MLFGDIFQFFHDFRIDHVKAISAKAPDLRVATVSILRVFNIKKNKYGITIVEPI